MAVGERRGSNAATLGLAFSDRLDRPSGEVRAHSRYSLLPLLMVSSECDDGSPLRIPATGLE